MEGEDVDTISEVKEVTTSTKRRDEIVIRIEEDTQEITEGGSEENGGGRVNKVEIVEQKTTTTAVQDNNLIIRVSTRTNRRRVVDLNLKAAQTIVRVVGQYMGITVYCAVFAFGAITNQTFASYIEQCGEPLLLVSMACFVVSLLIEQFPLHQIQFYSNLFSGLFLAGVAMYFAVFPPFGLLASCIFLSLLTASAIYATVIVMVKCGNGVGSAFYQGSARYARYQNNLRDVYGLDIFLTGLTVVPMALFILSQIMYWVFIDAYFCFGYFEFTVNIIYGLCGAMMICHERFRFLYYLLKAERNRYAKLDTVMLTLIKNLDNGPAEPGNRPAN